MNQPARRQSRPPAQEDWGIAIPFFAGIMILFALGCWPAFFWHGYTDTGGWRWDIHSTIGCCVWWGILALSAFLYWTDHRQGRPPVPRGRPVVDLPPPPPPSCQHLDAVPVDLSTGERVAWWCEACETQLDAFFGRFARSCCGTLPGTRHMYNCPHLKGSPS